MNPAGTRVYVPNSNNANASVIDTSTNTVVATISGLSAPESSEVNPAGTFLYIANTAANTVTATTQCVTIGDVNLSPTGSIPSEIVGGVLDAIVTGIVDSLKSIISNRNAVHLTA